MENPNPNIRETNNQNKMSNQELHPTTKLLSLEAGALFRPSHNSRGTTHMNDDSVIRTELPAHNTSNLTEQIPSIQNLLLHLEGKGRKPATLEAIEKG